MPDINLNGALNLSRSGDGEDIPAKTLERFKIAIKEHGYDSKEYPVGHCNCSSDCIYVKYLSHHSSPE